MACTAVVGTAEAGRTGSGTGTAVSPTATARADTVTTQRAPLVALDVLT